MEGKRGGMIKMVYIVYQAGEWSDSTTSDPIDQEQDKQG